MTRSGLGALAAAALVALSILLVVTLLGPTGDVPRAERADALAAELRCPDCQALSVADSPTAAAGEIRRQIDEMLASGATPDEVRAHFVARYGEWILLAPPVPVAWWLPAALVVAGVAGLALWLRPGRPHAQPPRTTAADAAARRHVRDDAEALDA